MMRLWEIVLKIKAQMSSIWAKGCMLMIVCVISLDMTTPSWWREKVMVYCIIKIYFCYLSYWMRLLLIVCDDVESNPGSGVVFMPILMSWLWLDQIKMFWFVSSLKSLIAAISQSSVSLDLLAPN